MHIPLILMAKSQTFGLYRSDPTIETNTRLSPFPLPIPAMTIPLTKITVPTPSPSWADRLQVFHAVAAVLLAQRISPRILYR
jgi:hypothetical protein